MANNCYNQINIEGKEKEIDILLENIVLHDNGMVHFEKIQDNLRLEGHYPDIFGTKWFDVDIERISKEEVIISGDSAWAPALGLFQKLSEFLPSLNIDYFYEEIGSDFCGNAEIKEGIIHDDCRSYWEGKFKEASGFAYELFFDDVEYFIKEDMIEEIFKHDAMKYLDKNQIKEVLNKILESLENVNIKSIL